MPRSDKEILNEIQTLEGVTEITMTDDAGKSIKRDVSYIEGYIEALIWCISTTDDEGEA